MFYAYRICENKAKEPAHQALLEQNSYLIEKLKRTANTSLFKDISHVLNQLRVCGVLVPAMQVNCAKENAHLMKQSNSNVWYLPSVDTITRSDMNFGDLIFDVDSKSFYLLYFHELIPIKGMEEFETSQFVKYLKDHGFDEYQGLGQWRLSQETRLIFDSWDDIMTCFEDDNCVLSLVNLKTYVSNYFAELKSVKVCKELLKELNFREYQGKNLFSSSADSGVVFDTSNREHVTAMMNGCTRNIYSQDELRIIIQNGHNPRFRFNY